jgi:hypothetical protein
MTLEELFGSRFGNIEEIESITTSKPYIRGNYIGISCKIKKLSEAVSTKTIRLDSADNSDDKLKNIRFYQKIIRLKKLEKEVSEIRDSLSNEYLDIVENNSVNFSLGVVSNQVPPRAETTKRDDDNSQNPFPEIVTENEIAEVHKKDGYDSKELKDIILKNGLQWNLKGGNAFNRFCQNKTSKKEHTFKIGKFLYLKKTSLDSFLSFAKEKTENNQDKNQNTLFQ